MSDGDFKPIVCAAVRYEDGTVIVGARHFSPDMRAVIKRLVALGWKSAAVEQGFIDTHSNYWNRQDAWVRAHFHMQIKKRVGGDTSKGGTLYSENLY